eukprot:m.50106 g.50106  ORF g.50106 m.50106 type:complete len:307 (-) comp10647_c0_seq2:24-944(-)
MKFAFFICGIFQRLFWEDLPLNLIKPLTDEGASVHIYYMLVNKSQFKVNIGKVQDYTEYTRFHKHVFQKSIEMVGGKLMHSEILDHDIEISMDFNLTMRFIMGMYSPNEKKQRLAVMGYNIIKRFECANTLFNIAVNNMKSDGDGDYDVFGLLREDAGFVRRLQPYEKWYDPIKGPDKIYTRNCAHFHGVSDKVILFGKNAAPKFLPKINAYLYDSRNLTSSGLFGYQKTKNCEQYLLKLAKFLDVEHVALPFSVLPVSDVIYETNQTDGENHKCFKKQYIDDRCLDKGFSSQEKTFIKKSKCLHH